MKTIFLLTIFLGLTAFSQNAKIDYTVTIETSGNCRIKKITNVEFNGKIFGPEFEIVNLYPGADVSKMPPNVQQICKAGWTKEVLEKYKKLQDDLKKRWGGK